MITGDTRGAHLITKNQNAKKTSPRRKLFSEKSKIKIFKKSNKFKKNRKAQKSKILKKSKISKNPKNFEKTKNFKIVLKKNEILKMRFFHEERIFFIHIFL